MKKFLFITHITPVAKRSALRQALIENYFKSLNAQAYQNWEVVIVGEKDVDEGKFHYFSLNVNSEEEKFKALKELLASERFCVLANQADYILKLDDDDIISPNVLEKVAKLDVDVYYDAYHTFYDISSGLITQQKRNWMASTTIHKKEHILAAWNGPGATQVGNLLYTNHADAWHVFYKDKNKMEAPKDEPIYLRILSPTSITSGALSGPPKSIGEIDMQKYYKYLSSFGNWQSANVKAFDAYLPALSQAWMNFSGQAQKMLPAELFTKRKKGLVASLKQIFSGKNK